MKKQINLYNAENELLEAHATKVFRSSPTLDMMVAKGLQQDEKYASAFRAREAARQNCKVGKKHQTYGGLPASQVRLIFGKQHKLFSLRMKAELSAAGKRSKEFYDEIQATGKAAMEKELVGCLGDGNECPGAGVCVPAGQRSRKEWCEHGNIISE